MSKETMSTPEYKVAQDRLINAAAIIAPIDLDRFLQTIEQTESMAPKVMDPEAYKKGAKLLEQVKRLATAAKEFHRAANELVSDLEAEDKRRDK